MLVACKKENNDTTISPISNSQPNPDVFFAHRPFLHCGESSSKWLLMCSTKLWNSSVCGATRRTSRSSGAEALHLSNCRQSNINSWTGLRLFGLQEHAELCYSFGALSNRLWRFSGPLERARAVARRCFFRNLAGGGRRLRVLRAVIAYGRPVAVLRRRLRRRRWCRPGTGCGDHVPFKQTLYRSYQQDRPPAIRQVQLQQGQRQYGHTPALPPRPTLKSSPQPTRLRQATRPQPLPSPTLPNLTSSTPPSLPNSLKNATPWLKTRPSAPSSLPVRQQTLVNHRPSSAEPISRR